MYEKKKFSEIFSPAKFRKTVPRLQKAFLWLSHCIYMHVIKFHLCEPAWIFSAKQWQELFRFLPWLFLFFWDKAMSFLLKNERMNYSETTPARESHQSFEVQHIHIQPKAWVLCWKVLGNSSNIHLSIGWDISLPIKSHIVIKKVKYHRTESYSLALPYLRHASLTGLGGLDTKHQWKGRMHRKCMLHVCTLKIKLLITKVSWWC